MYLATNRTNGALIYVLPFNYDEQYSTCSRVFNADVGPFWHSLNTFSLVGSVSQANKFRQRTRLMCHGHAIYPWLMVYIRPSSWLSCMPIAHAHAIASERYHPLVVPFKFEFWKVRAPWPPFFETPSFLDWPFSETPSLLDLPISKTRVFGFFSRKLRKLVNLCGKIIYNFKTWSYGWGE